MLAGLLFGPVVTSLKRWTLPSSFLGLSFAMCLIAVAQHLVVAAFAVTLCGLSFRTFVPYIFNEVNQPVNNGQKNTTVLLIAFNLGAAFAPVTIAFFNRMVVDASLSGLFLSEALLMLLLAVGSGLWLFKSRIKRLRAS